MDTAGTLIRKPGFASGYYVAADFKAYIFIMPEENDVVMDAFSGVERSYGKLDEATGALEDGDTSWYHFWLKGRSRLVNIETDRVIELPVQYRGFDATRGLWDNERVPGKSVFYGVKQDSTYDFVLPGNRFEVVKGLPPFESYDLVLEPRDHSFPVLTGYVVGVRNVINRQENGVYGIPASTGSVTVYTIGFKKLGTAVYNAEAIGKLFKKEVFLRGSMLAPPVVKDRVIRQVHQGREKLNDAFSVFEREDPTDPGVLLLRLEQTSGSKQPVFEKQMDYRYIGIPGAKNVLLQVRNAGSGSFFYFDYNGVFFPRGMPMIPKMYLQDM